MQRFVILHPDLGVFLGDAIVRTAWSRGDHHRFETAASFDEEAAAADWVARHGTRMLDAPGRLSVRGLDSATGAVTPEDLRAAGLADHIGELDANRVKNPWFEEIARSYRRMRHDGVGPEEPILRRPDEPTAYDFAAAGAQRLYEMIHMDRDDRDRIMLAVADEIGARQTDPAWFEKAQLHGPATQLALLYALGASIDEVDALFAPVAQDYDRPQPF